MNQEVKISIKSAKNEQIERLHMSEQFSDVVFVVGGRRFPAHKVILSLGSDYFAKMLFGQTNESKAKEIQLNLDKDDGQAFELILKYIYTNQLTANVTGKLMMRLVSLAHEYLMDTLVKEFEPLVIKSFLNLVTVLEFMQMSHLYNMVKLRSQCLTIIDQNAASLVKSEAFVKMPCHIIVEILQRRPQTLKASDIFDVVKQLIPNSTINVERSRLLNCVPLADIEYNDYLNSVKPSGLFSDADYLDRVFGQGKRKIKPRISCVCVNCNVGKSTPRSSGLMRANGSSVVQIITLANCGHCVCPNCIVKLAKATKTDVICPVAGCGMTIRLEEIKRSAQHSQSNEMPSYRSGCSHGVRQNGYAYRYNDYDDDADRNGDSKLARCKHCNAIVCQQCKTEYSQYCIANHMD